MTNCRVLFVFLFVLVTCSLASQTYQEWLDRSYLAAEGKDWSSATDCLRNALRAEPANPQNAWLLSNMGTMQRNMGKTQEALQSYTNGLLFAPNSVTLLLNRAAVLLEMDSLQAALLDYNSVIILDDQNKDAWVSMGEIRIALNDTTTAQRDFNAALKIDDHHFRALSGVALLRKMTGHYADSEKRYNTLLAKLPDDQLLLFNRAELFFLEQKLQKALIDINKLIGLNSIDPFNYFLRGKIMYGLYERKSAYQDFMKAKTLGYTSDELSSWIKKTK